MECGAPAGVYDDTGTTCLTHMIEKMPLVAAEALEQFQKVDKASRTVRYYLSYLETRKWNMLRDRNEKLSQSGWRELTMREPLEVCHSSLVQLFVFELLRFFIFNENDCIFKDLLFSHEVIFFIHKGCEQYRRCRHSVQC